MTPPRFAARTLKAWVTVQVPKALRQRLEAAARKHGTTLSSITRAALEAHLQRLGVA